MRSFDDLFGPPIAAEELRLPAAAAIERLVGDRNVQGYRLLEIRRNAEGVETLVTEVHVDRPQLSAYPLRAVEPIALQFRDVVPPRVLALREDFPDTPHQNLGHKDEPTSLCVDDRPWLEARQGWTPLELLVRAQTWLSKTARGELHGDARLPDPIYAQLGPVIVLPRSVLARASREGIALTVFKAPSERLQILLTSQTEQPAGVAAEPIIMFAVGVPPQEMKRLRHPPRWFGEVIDEVTEMGVDLRALIIARIDQVLRSAWDSPGRGEVMVDPPLMQMRLAVIVAIPVQDEGRTTTGGLDIQGYLTTGSIAELGVTLGRLEKAPNGVHGRVLVQDAEVHRVDMPVQTAIIQVAHDRQIASILSGIDTVDARPVALVGAGAIGSHVACTLAREGLFRWTVIDHDTLLSHNPVRHTLPPTRVGTPKAPGLAEQLVEILGEAGGARSIVANVMNPFDENAPLVLDALAEAEVILDASASVAVSRHLADRFDTAARRVSFFFNPDGYDGVLLSESHDRSATLRDVEAQYYALIARTPALSGHLIARDGHVQYAGACRQLTSRIPESRVAALSALLAEKIPDAVTRLPGRISIVRRRSNGIDFIEVDASAWHRVQVLGWTVSISREVVDGLTASRIQALPAETGGVLSGVTDTLARTIHVCFTFGPPQDSVGSPAGFERGVSGLREKIAAAATESAGQLTYVGEWHSHPPGSPVLPSPADILQLSDLASILSLNGLPGIMVIVGDDGIGVIGTGFFERSDLILLHHAPVIR